ncbi:hypothetical protein ET495_00665 [Xylanimonas allomyrinae]|uniref:Peptidase C39-like domain-containing protein n=1 Tax=Xylanimonas allomyrinae TaxID=2509459 RepID=A0A4P6EVI4_9MICO|nr:hypothetical protein [Xylanimonas allomyrinae]QAY62048.1 hypothetical protein ET495_00665 [Xylanimonas allomyrinae]
MAQRASDEADPSEQQPGDRGVAALGSDVADALREVGGAARRSVLDPLGRDRGPGRVGHPERVALPFLDDAAAAVAARQIDETTCGAAVLTMLAMAGSPRLALHVARDPGQRFAAIQRQVHRASSRSGVLPWPRRFGTAPWAAAAVARFGDVRFTHRVVGGGDRGAAVLRAAVAAASAGVPVPLYSGGDLGGAWQDAVPRHVVLLADVWPGEGVVRVYEPSSATMHTVPTAVLLDPEWATEHDRSVLTAALGAWPHVVWAVLPR